MPLVLGRSTDPEPDIAAVAGSRRGTNAHPTTAALVVEVADSSLRFVTSVKLGIYAAGLIAEYWVLDVNAPQLMVFRDPQLDATTPHGGTYLTQRVFGSGDFMTPLAAPGRTVSVGDLLP